MSVSAGSDHMFYNASTAEAGYKQQSTTRCMGITDAVVEAADGGSPIERLLRLREGVGSRALSLI